MSAHTLRAVLREAGRQDLVNTVMHWSPTHWEQELEQAGFQLSVCGPQCITVFTKPCLPASLLVSRKTALSVWAPYRKYFATQMTCLLSRPVSMGLRTSDGGDWPESDRFNLEVTMLYRMWMLLTLCCISSFFTCLRARAHWPLCLATGGSVFVADPSTLGRHVVPHVASCCL